MISSTQNLLPDSKHDTVTSSWKISGEHTHSLHRLCSRICSFPPLMPRYFIEQYSEVGDIVFDPWSGRGTVPFEALLNDRVGIGNDFSPEAYTLTKAKVQPADFENLSFFLDNLEIESRKHEVDRNLNELDKKAAVFYSKKTFEQLLIIREILAEYDSTEANFTKAILLGILHGKSHIALSLSCSHSYSMSPNYVKKYAKEHSLRRPSKNIIDEIRTRAELVLKDPLPLLIGEAYCADSRKLPLKDESVDLIFSSPPYFNVQTYAWCNWLRLWFLGYDYRLVRKFLFESASERLYTDFMRKSLKELYRVLKEEKRCLIVAGDIQSGRVDKHTINIIDFLTPLFTECGFTLEKVATDHIPSTRRVLTYISPTQGVKIERIALLVK